MQDNVVIGRNLVENKSKLDTFKQYNQKNFNKDDTIGSMIGLTTQLAF